MIDSPIRDVVAERSALCCECCLLDRGDYCQPPKQNVNFPIVAERGLVNGYVADFLTTGEFHRKPKEDRDAYLATFTDTDATLEYLNMQTTALLNAYESIDVNTLGDLTEVFGGPMSIFMLAELPVMHMQNHDGQINYIQTLYGDGASNW